jgi:hypothetical protein
MNKNNKIGHVRKGTSDKVYIVSIVDNGDGTYNAVGRYGRNQGNIKEAILATRTSRMGAESAANAQIRKKFGKSRDPYIDIDGPEYRHSLTRNDAWLKRWLEPEENTVTPKKVVTIPQVADPEPATRPGSKMAGHPSVQKKRKESEAKRRAGTTLELVCVDNIGHEISFSVGVEYLAKVTKDPDFYEVIDKFGDTHTMYAERFVTEAEAKNRGLLNEALA